MRPAVVRDSRPMTSPPAAPQDAAARLVRGARVRLPDDTGILVVDAAVPNDAGLDLYLQDPAVPGAFRRESLTLQAASRVQVFFEDGLAAPAAVLAGLWGEWILSSARSAASTALASAPLDPYPHQMDAVYRRMLPQPQLRFLLADEPGTGKTIMSGLWLREAQRLGAVDRALVVCPAHLVHKWIADFDRFFGGGLREVTAETVRQRALSVPGEDLWVVSIDLAARNAQVLDALRPDNAGWDAVIFDEAHRMTPTAETLHRVGAQLSAAVPHAVFLTATPHRGDEWYFRELLHLVDPDLFPTTPRPDGRRAAARAGPAAALSPGPLHFLRRMKEELVDYDTRTPLFEEREARNFDVHLNSAEDRLYERAQRLVTDFFPAKGRILAAMVYGKRTASSLHALACTLRRRSELMGTDDQITADTADPDSYDGEDHDSDEGRVVTARSLDPRAEKKTIKALLADIAELLDDGSAGYVASKWPQLVGCLASQQITPASSGQAVIFTEYADTAAWLVGQLQGAGFTAEPYSGALGHDERAKVQGRFMAGDFQVIVSTDAGNEGIDLQSAHVLVNWDVPWSLVRLEQRMGRIHRIGQKRKVWLYNLIATGTREGDAHHRLLERLVEAANELGGQMFDSLNAILERARGAASSEPQQMMRLFYPEADPGDGWPTLDEIRDARDRHYAEMRALATGVDTDAADTARRDDRLGRVNPIIVERFLDRADKANLIDCQKASIADEGFFYLTSTPSVHGWHLPGPFDTTAGPALAATRSKVRQQAIDAGRTRADDSVMLGPSDPALRSLAEGLRTRLAAEAYQGAVLHDETSSGDYTLFVYECDITEGAESSDRRQRPRATVCSWLIRVDADSTARVLAWDTLANLTAPDNPSERPLGSAQTQAADTRAADIAEDERARRAERLANWARQIVSQLRRLPDQLSAGIADRALRLRRREEAAAAAAERVAATQAATVVARGEPRRVAWAHITGIAPADDAEDEDDPESEAVSMRFVTDLLAAGGWAVTDVSRDGRGYDLHAVRAAEQRCVEVKGRKASAASTGVSLTGGELIEAAQLGADYWLYVVENCTDGTGRLYGAWPNPAETFRGRFIDVPTVRLAGGELKAALHLQGDPR